MPVNSGFSAAATKGSNQLAKLGSRLMVISGVSAVDMRNNFGISGRAAVAANGHMHSGGPTFNSQSQRFRGSFTITGVTKDSAGVSLGSCDVTLYETGSNTVLGKTISDGSGNYTFTVPTNSSYKYVVSYKVGSPDVAGTTVNTLVAV